MQNARKKILFLLLPIVMLISMMAMPAVADNGESESRTITLQFSNVGWRTEDGKTYCAADITASLDTDDEVFDAMLIQFNIVYNPTEDVLALDSVVESESIEMVRHGTGQNQKTSKMAADLIDTETADSLGYATVLMHGDNGVNHPIQNGQVIATAYFTIADESMKATATKLSFSKGVVNYIDDGKKIQNYSVITDAEADVPSRHTVTWKNEDGTPLETDEDVEYGTMPSYDGETPTKAATAEYSYTFNGWNPEVSSVTGEVTYTAVFIATKNKYTVTWKNEDGAVLETDEGVEYGVIPTYGGETPTKAATAEYTYTFNGWQPQVSPVTDNIAYTAVFISTKNHYTVTWKNEDGSILETDENVEYGVIPSYDGSTPVKSATTEHSYIFDKWTPEIVAVTADVTYTATFTESDKLFFTVKFNSNGGSKVNDQTVEIGKTASKPSNPTKSGYAFDAWYQDTSMETPYDFNLPVNSDLTLYARWSENGCYVATAVYGSYDCPEVWTLRRFRDNVLAKTWYGRLFIKLYYAVSPTAVKLFGDYAWFQNFFRDRLDVMVSDLQANGFESTPYQDQNW